MRDLEARAPVRDRPGERPRAAPCEPARGENGGAGAKRRRLALGAAGAGIIVGVVLAAGLVRPPETTQPATDRAVRPEPSPAGPPPPTVPGGLVVAGDQVLDLSVTPAREIARVPGIVTGSDPVLTRFGLVVASHSTEHRGLWLLPPAGESPRLLAEHVTEFAVATDGETIAWSEQPPVGSARELSSVLVLARLPDGHPVVQTVRLEGPVSVAGFVGDAVLLGTGDGPRSGIALWAPLTGRVVPVAGDHVVVGLGPGRVAHQPSARAVLGQGDSGCGVLVHVAGDGTAEVQRLLSPPGAGCLRPLGVSPNGQLLAGQLQPHELAVRSLADGADVLRAGLHGNLQQAVWLDDDQILVRSDLGGGHHEVSHCGVSTGSCARVWSGAPDSVPRDVPAVRVVRRAS